MFAVPLKRLAISLLILFTLVGLIVIIRSSINQLACEGQPINNNVDPTPAQQIFGERMIGQSFVAPRDRLNRVDIFFQTYHRANTQPVILRLLDVPPDTDNPFHGSEIFHATFSAAHVADQSWHTFNFPTQPDSAGKTYLITLQSPESEDGNAITVGGIERNSYLPGSAYSGFIPLTADITFRSCYQMTTIEKLQVLSAQITQNRPGVWGSPSFYWLNLVVYCLLLIGFFWLLIKWAL